jgi:cytidylate kinase
MPRTRHQLVEEQLARWRAEQRRRDPKKRHGPLRPNVVAIASAFQAGGSAVAAKVGQMLELPVYDHEILEHIATSAKVHVETVETLDLHVQNWIDEYLATLVRERNFDQSDYLMLLGRTVMALWEHGPCVFTGHGSPYVVPRAHALAVRLIAPESVRTARLAETEGIDLDTARRRVHRSDAEREAFHRRLFGVHSTDPYLYDVLINTAELSVDAAAAIVVESFRRKFAEDSVTRASTGAGATSSTPPSRPFDGFDASAPRVEAYGRKSEERVP